MQKVLSTLKSLKLNLTTKQFEIIDKNQIAKLLQSATEKYPAEEK